MNKKKSFFEKINEHCNLSEKCEKSVLDIGTGNGLALLEFAESKFERILGIDKRKMGYPIDDLLYLNLLENSLSKRKEIEREDRYKYFKSDPKVRYETLPQLAKIVNVDSKLQARLENLRKINFEYEIDFLKFYDYNDKQLQFNLVMCSHVLHFYEREKDSKIISLLKSLVESNGFLFLRYHNFGRLDTYMKGKEEFIKIDKKSGIIHHKGERNKQQWFLFDEERTNNIIKHFNLVKRFDDDNNTELILQNKKQQ